MWCFPENQSLASSNPTPGRLIWTTVQSITKPTLFAPFPLSFGQPKREENVEEQHALLVREDEPPPPPLRQSDVADGRDEHPEDVPIHSEVGEEGVFVAAKKMGKKVVPPPTISPNFHGLPWRLFCDANFRVFCFICAEEARGGLWWLPSSEQRNRPTF